MSHHQHATANNTYGQTWHTSYGSATHHAWRSLNGRAYQGHAGYQHIAATAPMFHGGGGFSHMIESAVVHFAMYRILGSIFRTLGPLGIIFCVVLLAVAWLLMRRRAY